jgi:ABC-type phosphate transport system substrate-binding protein
MRSKTIILLFFSTLALLVCSLPVGASSSDQSETDVIIIGNKKLPVDTLTISDIRDIFQRKKTVWDNGEKIVIALLEGGRTHEAFIRYYIHKTPAQYHRYWKKQVFSGRGVPPITFRSEKSLMAHVALTNGAIGYISSKFKPTGVKVIQIVTKGETIKVEKTTLEQPAEKPKKKKSKSFLDGLID